MPSLGNPWEINSLSFTVNQAMCPSRSTLSRLVRPPLCCDVWNASPPTICSVENKGRHRLLAVVVPGQDHQAEQLDHLLSAAVETPSPLSPVQGPGGQDQEVVEEVHARLRDQGQAENEQGVQGTDREAAQVAHAVRRVVREVARNLSGRKGRAQTVAQLYRHGRAGYGNGRGVG
uniref:Uncharacterized protein n=1 Tax=Cacopsylla melanoneura TaxID=428564 RepID=A0A8D8WCZ9_9HEMI